LERTLREQFHVSVDTVKTLCKAADRTQAAIKAAAERRAKQEAHLAQNRFSGQTFGKHEGEVDAQLSEELGESLRRAPQGWFANSHSKATAAHNYPLGRLAFSLPQLDFGAHSESCQTDGAAHAAVSSCQASCLALALVTLTLTHVQVPLMRHILRPV
jgi:hypothetical protein